MPKGHVCVCVHVEGSRVSKEGSRGPYLALGKAKKKVALPEKQPFLDMFFRCQRSSRHRGARALDVCMCLSSSCLCGLRSGGLSPVGGVEFDLG